MASSMMSAPQADITEFHELFAQLVGNVSQVVVGKEQPIRQCATAMIVGGHILLEDNPGTGKTQLVGTVPGGWPKTANIAVTLKKGSGLVEPVQTALNGVIKNGDYDKVLNRWGEGVERIPQSEVNPAGLGD